MSRPASLGAFCAYGNSVINDTSEANRRFYEAFRADFKRNLAIANYPTKDESDIVDTITNFEMTATLKEMPSMIVKFMRDEGRAFNLPAVDDNTAPGRLHIIEIDERTRQGTIMFGDRKGQPYTSTTGAHSEYRVDSNTDAFKK